MGQGSGPPVEDLDRFEATDRGMWRAWLESHHDTASGIWLVTWRKGSGRPILGYEDAVEEALAFGWIDSKGGKVDDRRTRLLFTPRKVGSGWSRPNQERIARLEATGLMAPSGQAVVDRARADGSYHRLDDVEDLVVPDDLAAAVVRNAPARANWDEFPRSVRRNILEWILNAKRDETRAKRIDETARMAARNERANQSLPRR
jgi:uncharacterized protein YdeI (YjbR/CyaY-like superfamily)